MKTFKDFMVEKGLLELYEKAKKYLPELPDPETVEYEPFNSEKPGVLGYVRAPEKPGERLKISFRDDEKPSLTTFYHEIIHLAQINRRKTANEIEAWNYPAFLSYAIEHDLEPFDVLKISELTREDVEEAIKSLGLGIEDMEGYFETVGVVLPPQWERMSTEDRLIYFFAELSAGLDAGEPLSLMIFEKLLPKLRFAEIGGE